MFSDILYNVNCFNDLQQEYLVFLRSVIFLYMQFKYLDRYSNIFSTYHLRLYAYVVMVVTENVSITKDHDSIKDEKLLNYSNYLFNFTG